MPQTISVPGRFNGPLNSGQGGYTAGLVAEFVDQPAEVTLRSPVPLEAPLDVVTQEDGSVQVLEGETVVAEGRSMPELEVEVPAPVGADEARDAASRYRGIPDGLFGHCFVCGRGRDDALGVFAGTVEGRELVASPWTPPEWTADSSGEVLPEFVWAVLDCPTYFGSYLDGELNDAVLGRMAVRIDAPVIAGDRHVVIAWPIEIDGRKRHAGAAVLSGEGVPLAVARALMIEPREGTAG